MNSLISLSDDNGFEVLVNVKKIDAVAKRETKYPYYYISVFSYGKEVFTLGYKTEEKRAEVFAKIQREFEIANTTCLVLTKADEA